MKLMDERIKEMVGCGDSMIAALRELQELRSQSTWIVVEERLPEDERDVLVIASGQPMYIGWMKIGGEWRIRGGSSSWANTLNVTHWRPLPAAPREGTK
jgi:hypothetical protein